MLQTSWSHALQTPHPGTWPEHPGCGGGKSPIHGDRRLRNFLKGKACQKCKYSCWGVLAETVSLSLKQDKNERKKNAKQVQDSFLQTSANRGLVRFRRAASRGILQRAFIVLPNTEWPLGGRRAKDYQIHRNLLPETPVCNLETRRDSIFSTRPSVQR